MMSESNIRSEIERHKKLRDFEISAKNPVAAKIHEAIIITYETVLEND